MREEFPIFSGDTDSNVAVNEFIERFLLFARAYQWGPDLRARTLPLFLAGRALDFYGSLPQTTKKQLSQVTKALSVRFDDDHRSRCAGLELTNRRKQKSESIGEYATCLRKLARIAFPRMDPRHEVVKLSLILFLASTT